ncbi:putative quinol monooxygenase [Rubrolithibacter danxiaensis]|uniref:putative quinol monooxygenase n=1 Tax=Rubrolithibacter danxiaensis TaxID=3390805 RepID=UPI003BF8A686
MDVLKITTEIKLIGQKRLTVIAVLFILIFSVNLKTMAQQNNQMVRLAKIKVDPSQLEAYNIALKEQMTTAIRVEPGVLTYYAVADKTDPTNITILEIYADSIAYKSHIETSHFKKYKETVKDMVKSLELVDVSLIGSAKKPDSM